MLNVIVIPDTADQTLEEVCAIPATADMLEEVDVVTVMMIPDSSEYGRARGAAGHGSRPVRGAVHQHGSRPFRGAARQYGSRPAKGAAGLEGRTSQTGKKLKGRDSRKEKA